MRRKGLPNDNLVRSAEVVGVRAGTIGRLGMINEVCRVLTTPPYSWIAAYGTALLPALTIALTPVRVLRVSNTMLPRRSPVRTNRATPDVLRLPPLCIATAARLATRTSTLVISPVLTSVRMLVLNSSGVIVAISANPDRRLPVRLERLRHLGQ